ncbi:MAG TPA: ABC transporter permease [Promineifilum sp.]|nr:ABC transporter permease [Promineifilum sp.]HNS40695.1 ABC transporter permease [Promineifilum sp.]
MSTSSSIVRELLRDRLALFGLVVVALFFFVAIFAPALAPHDPMEVLKHPETGKAAILQPPSRYFPFGTTNMARDVLSQVIYGSRIALLVGFTAAFVVTFIGANVGLIAGFYGGWVDTILMRIVDIAYAIPFVPFAILLIALLRPSIVYLIMIVGLLMWRAPARVIRAQVLSLVQRPYVKAARVTGASNLRIMYVHLMPNILPIVLLYIPLSVGWAIMAEASVSFLGFGDPRMVSWGGMLQSAFATGAMRVAWWWTLAPGIAIVLIVISVYFINRAFEPIASPSIRKE